MKTKTIFALSILATMALSQAGYASEADDADAYVFSELAGPPPGHPAPPQAPVQFQGPPPVQQQVPAGSHYQVLAAKFAAAKPTSKESLEGGFVGRCFHANDDTAIGTIVSTRRFTSITPSDGGPLFPATTLVTWKNTYYSHGASSDDKSLNASASDLTNKADDDYFWNNDNEEGRGGPEVAPLREVNGVVTGMSPGKDDVKFVTYETKRGADGYFYGRSTRYTTDGQVNVSQYCYFFKRLF